MATSTTGSGTMSVGRIQSGWLRVGVLFHPRIEASRPLAAQLAAKLEELGAEPAILDSWRGDELDARLGELDWVVALGGDGTMLRVARVSAPHGVPLIGVNFGRLGFLTELTPETAIEYMPRLLAGEAMVEKRIMLRCMARISGAEVGPFDAVNDVFVGRGAMSRPVRLDTWIDGAPLARYVADGLVVATPTGSTAYSLSAGGPVVGPEMKALIMTPVVAHPVPATAIVLPADTTIKAVVNTDFEAILSLDGQHCLAVRDGDEVEVTRGPNSARFLRIGSANSFYANLMERLQRGKTTPGTRPATDA